MPPEWTMHSPQWIDWTAAWVPRGQQCPKGASWGIFHQQCLCREHSARLSGARGCGGCDWDWVGPLTLPAVHPVVFRVFLCLRRSPIRPRTIPHSRHARANNPEACASMPPLPSPLVRATQGMSLPATCQQPLGRAPPLFLPAPFSMAAKGGSQEVKTNAVDADKLWVDRIKNELKSQKEWYGCARLLSQWRLHNWSNGGGVGGGMSALGATV